MAGSNKRTTRSMAAAARKPSIPAEYEVEGSLTSKVEDDTWTAQQGQLDHSEGARWLLANQGLLDDSKAPTYMKEEDAPSIKAKEELGVKAVGTALGWRDDDGRAADQGSLEDEHWDPSSEDELATFSNRDTNILRPHLKGATLDEDTTTVEPSAIGESKSQLEVANENLRKSLRTERTRITALEQEKAIQARSWFFLRANLSSSGPEEIAEREANFAGWGKQNAELANKMKNLKHDFSGRKDKIVEQEAKISAMQQEKADMANKLNLVRSDFRQLEDLLLTERLHQGNEIAYLEEQLVAFNQSIASLEGDKNQLQKIVDQQRLEGQKTDRTTFDESSSSVEATNQSRVVQVEEENQRLKSKLIDTLDKLVAAQVRLENFATAQTQAAGWLMPHEGQQGTKRPGSACVEPAAKKVKDLKLANSEFSQTSNMSSVDHYLCLVPQRSVFGTDEVVEYAQKSDVLSSSVLERVQSLIVTFANKSTKEGFSAWQSAAAMKSSCAFCRYISGKESEWYQDDRACARCTKNHRPCIVVHQIGGEDIAVLLPLIVDRRQGLKPSDTGYWIRL